LYPWGVVVDGWVVDVDVDVAEEVAAQGVVASINPQTYGIFNLISFHLHCSTFHKIPKLLKLLIYLSQTYSKASIILSGAITMI
jgi:hypothetical protein